jgi:hypothetical protein
VIVLALFALSGDLPYNLNIGPGFHGASSGFGQITDSFDLSALEGYTLAGITYCARDSLFYIMDLFGCKVWSFDPSDPLNTLTERSFALVDYFNDGFPDWQWGIAWGDTSFFITSASAAVDSAALSEYSYSGVHKRTWRLDSLARGWFAGADYDYQRGLLWLVNVRVGASGTNRAYAVNPDSPSLALDSAFQWSSSQRGAAYFGLGHSAPPLDTITWLMVGGWNEDMLYKLDGDETDHPGIESAPMPDMADLDIWEDTSATDSVFAFVTTNGPHNRIYKVFLGITWDEWFTPPQVKESSGSNPRGLVIKPNPSKGLFSVCGAGPGSHKLRAYNTAGGLVLEREFAGEGVEIELPAAGVYLIEVEGRNALVVIQ